MIRFLGKNVLFNNCVLHRVLENETIYDIAKIYSVNPIVLEKKYGTKLYAGSCIVLKDINKKYHIVKPAETIKSICMQYDISPDELLRKNNIQKLFIGEILEI